MAGISAQELVDLFPCSLEQVSRLNELGLLTRQDEDGLFPSSDVHVVRLMAAFEDAGISVEDVARGVVGASFRFRSGSSCRSPWAERRPSNELKGVPEKVRLHRAIRAGRP